MKTKRCSHCHQVKPVSEFNKNRSTKDGLHHQCKECQCEFDRKWRGANPERAREVVRQSRYRRGLCKPLGTNPNCPCFLGIHVAERVLSHVYENVEKMPYGHPGFDFVCGRGFKIDVKSACRRHNEGRSDRWLFTINKNTTADYFLCLAFDNRTSLNPEHVWLLPGSEFNHLTCAAISESLLGKWSEFELHEKLEEVVACCDAMKSRS